MRAAEIILAGLCFSGVCCFAKTNRYNETTQTMNYLFDEKRYDKRIRPYIGDKVVNVTVTMTIVNFGQIREKDMDFSLDVFFYQEWFDERLAHHTSKNPISLSGQYSSLVWMPDTFFLNIKTAKTHSVPTDNTKVTVLPNGYIRHSTRLTLTAGCEMNLLDYPLDTQNCNLTILSYSFQQSELDYIWGEGAKHTIEIMNDAMNEFTLKNIKLDREIYQYVIGPWVHLNAMFTFKRRIGFSLLQVYAPTVLIVSLSWLSFWISKDAAPARIALGITTVLTIVTLMGSLRSGFPKVSYVKAIDLFFIVSFLFVFAAVMEYILVLLKCALDENKAQQKELRSQRLAQKIELEYRKGLSNDEQRSDESEHDALASKDGEDEERQDAKKGIHRRTMRKTKNIIRFVFIEQNAHVIDRMSRVVFPVGYLLFNVVYWLYYLLNTFN